MKKEEPLIEILEFGHIVSNKTEKPSKQPPKFTSSSGQVVQELQPKKDKQPESSKKIKAKK
jgi:hypothetical protein